MSDGFDKKNQGIPSWQKAAASLSMPDAPPTPDNAANVPQDKPTVMETHTAEAMPDSPSSDQDALIEQAMKFLQDENVRDASMEEKLAFLESKGLKKPNIEAALGLTKNEIKSSTLSAIKAAPSYSTNPSPDFGQSFKDEQENTSIPRQDIPPIITYPEFLMQPQKPPPLITVQRLITTAYIAGGISAAIYGASKYLIAPMTEALTSARHDFAANAQTRLDELNHKLTNVVSVDPKDNPNVRLQLKEADLFSEADTTDSDPTELFHRDYGTQTSPILAATPDRSLSDTSSGEADPTDDAMKVVNSELHKLRSIKFSCSSLNDDNAMDVTGTEEVSKSLKSLHQYLDSLINPPYNYVSSSLYGSGMVAGTGAGAKADGAKKDDDEILRLKAEIRGIKGVLLSARNFPSGGRKAMFPNPANTS